MAKYPAIYNGPVNSFVDDLNLLRKELVASADRRSGRLPQPPVILMRPFCQKHKISKSRLGLLLELLRDMSVIQPRQVGADAFFVIDLERAKVKIDRDAYEKCVPPQPGRRKKPSVHAPRHQGTSGNGTRPAR